MAISKMRGGKAEGMCVIPAKLLKTREEPMARDLHTDLAGIWNSYTIPLDLLREAGIPLWKEKWDRWNWSNY